MLWNKVLKSLKVIASSGLDKITLRIHNQSGIIQCTVCVGWHRHWTQGWLPQQGTEPNAWCGQQELQVLIKFGYDIILWLSITIGLVRALKTLPGSYKISIYIMIEIKRNFWRYLVQLPDQAESPRAGCSGPPTDDFWVFPKMDISKSLWAICSSAYSLSQ